MGTLIVSCDACGTKNKVQEEKAMNSVCGRCKNPLLDAVQAQTGLSFNESEESDEEEGEDDDDDDPFGSGKSAKTIEDVMKDLFKMN